MDGFHIAPVMLQQNSQQQQQQQQGAQQTHQILQTLNGQQILVPMSSNGQSVQFIQVGGQQLQVLQAPTQATSVAQVVAAPANKPVVASVAASRATTSVLSPNQLPAIKQVTQQPGTQLIQTLDGQTLLYQPTMVQADGTVQIPSGQVLTLTDGGQVIQSAPSALSADAAFTVNAANKGATVAPVQINAAAGVSAAATPTVVNVAKPAPVAKPAAVVTRAESPVKKVEKPQVKMRL